jgi:hypothetical protein
MFAAVVHAMPFLPTGAGAGATFHLFKSVLSGLKWLTAAQGGWRVGSG